MKLLGGFLLSSALLPWAIKASVVKPDLGLSPRQDNQQQEDDRYDDLYKDGLCRHYLPYDRTSESLSSYKENDRLQSEVCYNYCTESEEKPGGTCSIQMYAGESDVNENCSDGFSYSCLEDSGFPGWEDDMDGGTAYWTMGKCECVSEELAETLGELVGEIGSALGKVVCNVFNTAIDVLIEIASDALSVIPGGQALGVSVRLVKTAKTMAENGLEAADFYKSYLGGDLCSGDTASVNVPDNSDDVFNTLVNSPDSLNGEDMTSLGCKKKKKSDCKKLDSHPGVDKPVGNKGDKGDDSGSSKTKDDGDSATSTSKDGDETATSTSTDDSTSTGTTTGDGTSTGTATDDGTTTSTKTGDETSTSTDSSTSTTTEACELNRRGSSGKSEGKLGDDETTTDNCRNPATVHVTKTKIVSHYETTIPQTCSQEYEQACYHYRSVMSVHSNTKQMTEFTCGATAAAAGNRKAPDVWGATAVAPLQRAAHHWGWPWANGWLEQGPEICQRDEWPPFYFWNEKEAKRLNMKQWIRLVPGFQNGGAGKIWGGFCNDNGAQSTKVLGGATKSYIQSDHLTTRTSSDLPDQVNKGTTTKYTQVEIDTMRAIFSFAAFPGLNSADPLNGLEQNPCWPSDVATNDPGWPLMTDDPFYQQNPQMAQYTGDYRKAPPISAIQNAIKANGGFKYPLADVDLQSLVGPGKKIKVGNGDGQIPASMTTLFARGMEPDYALFQRGAHVPYRRNGTFPAGNGTEPEDPDKGEGEGDDEGEEATPEEISEALGGMSLDEFLDWYQQWASLVSSNPVAARGLYYDDSAEPTESVDYEAPVFTPPPVAGSVAKEELPQVTQMP